LNTSKIPNQHSPISNQYNTAIGLNISILLNDFFKSILKNIFEKKECPSLLNLHTSQYHYLRAGTLIPFTGTYFKIFK
jgi:hypothetical protein